MPPSIPVAASIEEVERPDVAYDDEGVFGGVEGGVSGGVIGGVVGGLPDVPPPPPPPPPPPRAPIRAGGALKPPALITRVPPVYPGVAVSARIEGVVILEATVGRDGRVEEVRVLRSVPLLDTAAMDAVLQWQYAPLLLNGKAERFILTVTLTFNFT
jgi:protein TonB